jgi:hypothetical protein
MMYRDVQCYDENLSLMAKIDLIVETCGRKLLLRDGDKNLLSPPRHLWGANIFGTGDLDYSLTQSSPPVTPAGFLISDVLVHSHV